jgi:glycosyltransferase involved in cell wall biosynthesis
MNPKVAIVATHPIQHFCPLYRTLASSGKITLRVFFATTAGLEPYYDRDFGQLVKFQSDLTSGFDHEFLPGHVAELNGRIRNRHVGERLTAFDPDVVQVYGRGHPLFRDVMKWARAAGRPILFWSDAELLTRCRLWKRVARRMVFPRVFSRCAGFLTIGDCNSDFYRYYGVPSDRLFRSPYPIDDIRLIQAVEARSEARRELLERYSLPADAIVALVVGKLTVRKAPDHAIRAVSQAWKSGMKNRLFLILAGNGPERENLQALAAACEPAAIRFAGFVEVSELPSYYAAADLLIHPSSEDPHPLATSEAVFCGLPVIVSDRVGSAGPTDDVRIGINGLRYKYGDVDRLTELLLHFCGHPEEAEKMRGGSRSIGPQRTLRVSAEGYLKAVAAALEKSTG